MRLILRKIPEDFIVDEIIDKDIKDENDKDSKYYIYKLEKKSIEGIKLFKDLEERFKTQIGYAGIKDKYGITSQYITTKKDTKIDLKQKNLEIKCIGSCKKPIVKGSNTANRFKITIRKLDDEEIKKAKEKYEDVIKNGFINYYDSQRFRSAINRRFIFKHVIRNHYRTAIKIYLTEIYPNYEPARVKNFKKFMKENFDEIIENKNFASAVEKSKNTPFYDMMRNFQSLSRKEEINDALFKKLYLMIPHTLRDMYKSAFQSYIWNEAVKLMVKRSRKKYRTSNNNVQELYLNEEKIDIIEKMPLISSHLEKSISNNKEKKNQLYLIKEILKNERVRLEQLPEYVKTDMRQIFVLPKNTNIEEKKDELYKGKKKLIVEFELPKGSYATIFLKNLFD